MDKLHFTIVWLNKAWKTAWKKGLVLSLIYGLFIIIILKFRFKCTFFVSKSAS